MTKNQRVIIFFMAVGILMNAIIIHQVCKINTAVNYYIVGDEPISKGGK